MTAAVSTEQTPTARSRVRRYQWLAIAALVVIVGASGYVIKFGGCDTASKFCHLGLAGTRSEVVVGWLDGFEIFTQTYPASE